MSHATGRYFLRLSLWKSVIWQVHLTGIMRIRSVFFSSGKCWKLLWEQSLIECVVADVLNGCWCFIQVSLLKTLQTLRLSFKWNACSSNYMYTYVRYIVVQGLICCYWKQLFCLSPFKQTNMILFPQTKMILAIAKKTIRTGNANNVQWETRARLRMTNWLAKNSPWLSNLIMYWSW